MSDKITIKSGETLKEIAEKTDVDEESLIEYVAAGIEEAHDADALEAFAKALGPEELN